MERSEAMSEADTEVQTICGGREMAVGGGMGEQRGLSGRQPPRSFSCSVSAWGSCWILLLPANIEVPAQLTPKPAISRHLGFPRKASYLISKMIVERPHLIDSW